LRVLRSGWLTTGAECDGFETEFARAVGAAHALGVSSATAGLHLAVEALGLRPGQRVVTTPHTFAATAEILRYTGAHPVFADIDDLTLNLDPEQVAQAVEEDRRAALRRPRARPKVKDDGPIVGVLPVHLGGYPADMPRIASIADTHGLWVVEDAAHAFPLRTEWGTAGTVGDAGVFSFYATKTITTAEGGMVVTHASRLADRMRTMRLHGIDRPVWDRFQADGPVSADYDVVAPGYKYNLSDLAAAMGREQLRRADEFLDRRRSIAAYYLERMSRLPCFRPPPDHPGHCWHLFILRLNTEHLTVGRNEFMRLLMDAGIGVSLHYRPLHHMSYYRDLYGLRPDDFPISTRAYRESVSLPLYPSLSDSQVERVADTVLSLGRRYERSGVGSPRSG
jgi:dTDP-4-amino-4,6-dideoxygalactose transaminase